MRLGSLFDGIGGFPLAAIRHGITPVWASEIERFPIEVTKIRFPNMLHAGDITKLNGANLPLVDIITGGSPCQDLSIAGKRAGLAGERSGLFMEQIRIVKEMRNESRRQGGSNESIRPRHMVWENVPGAFSSAGGEDFRVVLEETARIADNRLSIPRPSGGTWKSAGCILGDKFSIAWRILDTQYWPSTPQRRKRIFLIADFTGHTAPQILFEQHGMSGDSAPCESAGQGIAGGTAQSTGDTGRTVVGSLTSWDVQSRRIVEDNGVWPSLYGCSGGGHGYVKTESTRSLTPWDRQQDRISVPDGISPNLAGADGGGGRNPAGLVFAGFSPNAGAKSGGIGYIQNCVPTLKGSSGGNMVPSILCINDQGGNNQPVLFENHPQDARYNDCHDVAPTVATRYGTGGENAPLVLNLSLPTAYSLDSTESNSMKSSNPYSGCREVDIARTIDTTIPCPSKNQGGIAIVQETYAIAGNIIDRNDKNGGNGIGFQSDICYTITATDQHCVCSQDTYQDTVGTLCRGDEKGVGNQYVSQDKCIVTRDLIRRLTPLECERLQGFPDGWTDIPSASDSARYKALGNSVAIPCVEYVLGGIALVSEKEKHV